MAIFMVSVMKDYLGMNIEGIGLIDSNTREFKVASEYSVSCALREGVHIENLALKDYKFVGTNGALSRYAVFKGNINNLYGPSPLVILNEIVKDGDTIGFEVSDYKGQVKVLSYKDALRYATKLGIANGKIVETVNGKFISSISGSYNKVEYKSTADSKVAKYKALFDSISEFKDGRATVKKEIRLDSRFQL